MLKKGNIILRTPEPSDLDFLFGLENDSKIWNVSQTRVPFSRFDLEQYILTTNRQEPFAQGQVRFILEVIENNTQVPAGLVDIFNLDALHRRGAVGIVLAEAWRGRSLAGKALDMLIDYAFNFLNLHQLYCNIEKENEASMRLFRSRNFQLAGLKKDWQLIRGEWKDEYLLQLIHNE